MKRIAELDALRGMAAVSIVAFHYSYPSRLHDRLLYLGGTAMELFFVLSGFLITSIIIAHEGQAGFLKNFYVRRGLRIWPIYYLMVGLFAALIVWKPALGHIAKLPQYLTFTQNVECYWAGGPDEVLAYPLIHTWSLAVEEQFYILWPLMLHVLGVRRLVPIAVGCLALGVAARQAGYSTWLLATRCDNFAVGGLLALVLAGHRSRSGDGRGLTAAALAIGGACAATLAFGLAVPVAGAAQQTVICALFACIIAAVAVNAGHPLLAPLRARWLCYLGTISYGIYLYHLMAIVAASAAVRRLHLPDILAPTVIAPLACLAIAAASWAWIERPCLALKDRFSYGRPRQETPIEADAPPTPADDLLIDADR